MNRYCYKVNNRYKKIVKTIWDNTLEVTTYYYYREKGCIPKQAWYLFISKLFQADSMNEQLIFCFILVIHLKVKLQ